MMITLLVLAIVLIGAMALLVYRLATFALPFMLMLEAARFAFATGAGRIGAGIVRFFAGVASFGILALLFATLRAPVQQASNYYNGAERTLGQEARIIV
ncbi:hypothetical protein NKH48_19220 [Mesorhizobium sp. M1233]|uniref:hypothetical protein n=1 Tax=Mesorhizobium sp. M1233 TaxID=2957072 RepID=UPI003339B486